MHTLSIRVQDTNSEDGQPVTDFIINGRLLQEWLQEIELPYATKEGHPQLAGAYDSLPVSLFAPPSRYLFDDPPSSYRRLRDQQQRLPLLDCSCGCRGCWPFYVRITVTDSTVTWSHFHQPHRSPEKRARRGSTPWYYDQLEPFIFDIHQYEKIWQGLGNATPI